MTTEALKAEWVGIPVLEWWHKGNTVAAITEWPYGDYQVTISGPGGIVGGLVSLGRGIPAETARCLLRGKGFTYDR